MASQRIAAAIREPFTVVFDAQPERFLIYAAAANAAATDRADGNPLEDLDDDDL